MGYIGERSIGAKISRQHGRGSTADGPEYWPRIGRTTDKLVLMPPKGQGWPSWIKAHLLGWIYNPRTNRWVAPLDEAHYRMATWAAHRLHGRMNWTEHLQAWAKDNGFKEAV